MGREAASSKTGSKSAKAAATKVIIRHLPPEVTKEWLLSELGSDFPAYDYLYVARSETFGRAYLNLTSPEDLLPFRERFDGYVLVDAKGGEFPLLVELAPNQKLPDPAKRREEKRKDPKMGTIENDADFLAFKAALEKEDEAGDGGGEEVSPLEAALREIEQREAERKDAARTPLVEFMLARREERLRKAVEKRKANKAKEEESRRRKAEKAVKAKAAKETDAAKVKVAKEGGGRQRKREPREEKEAPTTKKEGASGRKRRERREKPPKAKDSTSAAPTPPATVAPQPSPPQPPPTPSFKPRKEDDTSSASASKSSSSGKSYTRSRGQKERKAEEKRGEEKREKPPKKEKKEERTAEEAGGSGAGGGAGGGAPAKPRGSRRRPDMARYTPGQAKNRQRPEEKKPPES